MARTWNADSRPNANEETPTVAKDEMLTVTKTAADIITSEAVDKIVETTDELVFIPTWEQKKARSMFYATARARQTDLKPGITFDLVQDLMPTCRSLRQWWHNELFVDWFVNSSTYQTRIDYLIDLQLDNLEDVITNAQGLYTTRDQVAAGKQLAEYKKAFIDEDKARAPDAGTDMIKAIAARMLEAKRLAAASGTVDAEILPDEPRTRVELP